MVYNLFILILEIFVEMDEKVRGFESITYTGPYSIYNEGCYIRNHMTLIE